MKQAFAEPHPSRLFSSGFGDGLNHALFDIEAATPINCGLFDVTEIQLEIEETANTWFSAAHYGISGDA